MKLRQLQGDAERESYRKSQAIEQSLTILLRKLAEQCGVAGNGDRASIYYMHDGRFVMPARWSIHPDYRQAKRKFYLPAQGAIGAAWDRGFVITTLPATRVRWEKALVSNWGFSPEEAVKMTMMCQSIGGLRMSSQGVPVGVLIFESLDPNRVTLKTLRDAGSSMIYAALTELIVGQAAMTPRVEEVVRDAAKKSGPPWKPVENKKKEAGAASS
jgi:hypothetical protein